MVSGLGLDRSSMGSCGWGCETGSWAMMGNWHTTELIRDWGTRCTLCEIKYIKCCTSSAGPGPQPEVFCGKVSMGSLKLLILTAGAVR